MIKCRLNDFLPGTGSTHRKGWQGLAEPPAAPLLAAASAFSSPEYTGQWWQCQGPLRSLCATKSSGSAEPGIELVEKGQMKKPG